MDDARLEDTQDRFLNELQAISWTEGLAARLVHDPALAADIHQDAWRRAIERFGRELPGRRWFAGTMRSLVYRERRGVARRRRRESERESGPSIAAPSTEEVVERAESYRVVSDAVTRLPDDLRLPILLRFQEEMSVSEVAEHLGCSRSTAFDRVQRGLVQLRAELGADEHRWRRCCALAAPLATSLSGARLHTSGDGVASGQSGVAATLMTGVTMKFAQVAVLVVALALLVTGAFLLADDRAPRLADDSGPEESAMAGLERADLDGGAASEIPASELDDAAVRTSVESPGAEESLASQATYTLAMTVVDEHGKALGSPRLRMISRPLDKEVHGGADGRLVLTLDEAELARLRGQEIRLEAGGDAFHTLWSARMAAAGGGELSPPWPGGHVDLGTISLAPAGGLRGRVVDPTGAPVAGATIEVFEVHPEQPRRRFVYRGQEPEVQSAADGTFLVGHLEARSLKLAARHPAYRSDALTAEAQVVLGAVRGPVELEVVPAPFVEGRVLDEEGEPLAGAYVNCTGPGPSPTPR